MKKYRRLIAMGLAVSLFSLFGCTKREEKFKPDENAEIRSLSIFESQMDFSHCYSFGIFEEDDGTVYLSAEFQPSGDSDRVAFENFEVDKEDMNELRKIADKNGVVEYFKTCKTRKTSKYALDAPSYSSSIEMSDGSSKTVNSLCDGSSELRSFFIKIAEKYDGTGSSEVTTSDVTSE